MTWDYNSGQFVLLLFASLAVLFLPGYVALRLLLWKGKDIGQTMALSVGLSLSVGPLAAELFFHLPWEPPSYAFLLAVIFVTILSLGFALSNIFRRGSGWVSAGLVLGAFTAAGWRLWQVRHLVLPAGTESLNHVLITRKILEMGRIPENLEPYLGAPFHGYFSFDVLCAAFAGLAGSTPAQAVLLLGQVLNGLAVLSLYRLAVPLLEDRGHAAMAAALALFLVPQPADYSSWGGYSLLVGAVLLPLALAEILIWYRDRDGGSLLRLALLTAGTLLAHFISALLLSLFLAIWLAAEMRASRRAGQPAWSDWAKVAASLLAGLLPAYPWLHRSWVFAGQWAESYGVTRWDALTRFFLPPPEAGASLFAEPWNLFFLGLVAIGGLAFAWMDSKTRLFAVWSSAFLLALIPGMAAGQSTSPADPFLLFQFIPLSLCFALFFSRIQSLRSVFHGRKSARHLMLGLALFVLASGLAQHHTLRRTEMVLAEKEDLVAFRWLEENVSRRARFLVNAAYREGVGYRGTDGGAWILPLTARWTTVLPPVAGIAPKADAEQVEDRVRRSLAPNGCDDSFRRFLEAEKITHVYLGARPGKWKPQDLDGCPILGEVFRLGPVRIYRVNS